VSVRTPSRLAPSEARTDRLARIVRHRKGLHQQVADGKPTRESIRLNGHSSAASANVSRSCGERTVRQPHRDAETARERKYAFAVVGVLVRDDYSERSKGSRRCGPAVTLSRAAKPAVEHVRVRPASTTSGVARAALPSEAKRTLRS